MEAVGLLDRDGLYWVIRNLVSNFTGFAPLGVVLVVVHIMVPAEAAEV